MLLNSCAVLPQAHVCPSVQLLVARCTVDDNAVLTRQGGYRTFGVSVEPQCGDQPPKRRGRPIDVGRQQYRGTISPYTRRSHCLVKRKHNDNSQLNFPSKQVVFCQLQCSWRAFFTWSQAVYIMPVFSFKPNRCTYFRLLPIFTGKYHQVYCNSYSLEIENCNLYYKVSPHIAFDWY